MYVTLWYCRNVRFVCVCVRCLFKSFRKSEGLYIQSVSCTTFSYIRSVRVAERLALPTSDHGVAGSNPAGGEILPEPKRRFIAQSLSCSPFHRLEMTEILLKGRKTLTHPSIFLYSKEHQFEDNRLPSMFMLTNGFTEVVSPFKLNMASTLVKTREGVNTHAFHSVNT